ncbi:MAG: DNA primase [Calditrichaeota bacterium]|nr:MAG: DNA primase [Calditrichota bacterium]
MMAQIPDHIIDRIRESVDIVELISRYLSLRKSGKNYKTTCPFHTEKTPSFTVSPDKQIFYCFGCGAGGNVFNFLMRYEKISFIEALQKLSEETGIALPKFREDEKKVSEYDRLYRANQIAADLYYQLLKQNYEKLQDYFKKREISGETIDQFRIGYVPDRWDTLFNEITQKKLPLEPFLKTGLVLESEKDRSRKYDRFRNRLIFPVHNLSGRIVAFGGRDLSNTEDTPKYVNSPESAIYNKSQILYGLFYSRDWIRQEEYVIMVEGYMDFLQLFQNGIKNVVATSGTALTEDHAKLIRRYTPNVVLCYDGDAAGIQAASRGGQILFQENLNVRVVILPGTEDPDSFVRSRGTSEFYALIKQAEDFVDFRLHQLQTTIGFKDVSQKARVTEEMIDVVASHSDPIKQNFYANLLAQKFQIQESTLIEKIRKKSRILRSRERKTDLSRSLESGKNSLGTLFTGAWNAEKDILIILLNHFPHVHNIVFQLIDEEDFLNPPFRSIFNLLKNHGQQQEDLIHWILTQIEDEKIIGLLTADLFVEIQNPDRYLNDCIQRIKITRYQYRIDELRQTMRQLPPDQPDYQDILKQVNENLTQIQKIRKAFAQK